MKYNKVLVAIFGILMTCTACKRESKDEAWTKLFQQFTAKECPKFVDECTRLDSACYDAKSRTLSYHYTVQGMLDSKEVYADAKTTSAFHEDILRGLKGNLPLKPYKDEGINFCYDYRSITTGEMLFSMTFTKEDYGK